MQKLRPVFALLLCTCVLCADRTAWASDLAAAEALFDDGKRLMQAGQTELACRKFEESGRLDPSPGTSLNLARCYQKLGRSASAWAQYQVAERLARAQNRPSVAAEAAKQAAELGPTLGTVEVVVSAPLPGLAVQLGDVVLESGAIGSAIPFDPGTYTLRVTAPGHQPHEAEVIVEDGEATQVTVPALEPEAEATPVPVETEPPPPAPPPVSEGPPPDEEASTLPYWLGGGGLVLLGGGVVLGALAKSENESARDRCGDRTTDCPRAAMTHADRADTFATVGTVVGTVGVVALGVGAALWFTGGPNEPGDSALADWSVSLGGDSASFVYRGEFQ